jgi:type VI secretion system secreted protein Hcp
LWAEGETQGKIKGAVTQAGREESIMVDEVYHQVVSPRDAASGLPTGKRQHKPFGVRCETGPHTPLLFNALVTNENLPNLRIDFWRPSRAGKEFQYFTVELVNASVASIRTEMYDVRDPETSRYPNREHIEFCYQKIVWTYQDGGITAEDDWETPVA